MGCRPSKQATSKVRSVDQCLCSPRKVKKKHKCASASTGSSRSARTSGNKSGSQKTSAGRSERSQEARVEPNPEFPAFSTTSATYRRSAAQTSRITLRLSCDGSTLEIERCDYDIERSPDGAMERHWNSAPNLSKFRDGKARLFRNSQLPLKHSASVWTPNLKNVSMPRSYNEATRNISGTPSYEEQRSESYQANGRHRSSTTSRESPYYIRRGGVSGGYKRQCTAEITRTSSFATGQIATEMTKREPGRAPIARADTDDLPGTQGTFIHSVQIQTNPSFSDSSTVLNAMIDDLELACNKEVYLNTVQRKDQESCLKGQHPGDKSGSPHKQAEPGNGTNSEHPSSPSVKPYPDDYESPEQILVNVITSFKESGNRSSPRNVGGDRRSLDSPRWVGWDWSRPPTSPQQQVTFLEDSASVLDLVALGCPVLDDSSEQQGSLPCLSAVHLQETFLDCGDDDEVHISDVYMNDDFISLCVTSTESECTSTPPSMSKCANIPKKSFASFCSLPQLGTLPRCSSEPIKTSSFRPLPLSICNSTPGHHSVTGNLSPLVTTCACAPLTRTVPISSFPSPQNLSPSKAATSTVETAQPEVVNSASYNSSMCPEAPNVVAGQSNHNASPDCPHHSASQGEGHTPQLMTCEFSESSSSQSQTSQSEENSGNSLTLLKSDLSSSSLTSSGDTNAMKLSAASSASTSGNDKLFSSDSSPASERVAPHSGCKTVSNFGRQYWDISGSEEETRQMLQPGCQISCSQDHETCRYDSMSKRKSFVSLDLD